MKKRKGYEHPEIGFMVPRRPYAPDIDQLKIESQWLFVYIADAIRDGVYLEPEIAYDEGSVALWGCPTTLASRVRELQNIDWRAYAPLAQVKLDLGQDHRDMALLYGMPAQSLVGRLKKHAVGYKKTCPQCKVVFKTLNRAKKYCSPACLRKKRIAAATHN